MTQLSTHLQIKAKTLGLMLHRWSAEGESWRVAHQHSGTFTIERGSCEDRAETK